MKHNVFQLFRSYLQAGKEQLKNLKGNPFKKKWLKRLDRYIIVKFLGTYFFAIALIISIAVVFDINENIDVFINNKAPISAIIFDYSLNFIPDYTNLFSPLFVFIAVIFFTSKLAENSEIIVMFSTGMSFKPSGACSSFLRRTWRKPRSSLPVSTGRKSLSCNLTTDRVGSRIMQYN